LQAGGYKKERRFKMEQTLIPFMVPMVGKSVISPYYLLHHLASVEMFNEIGTLIEKRNAITSYLEFILHEIDKEVESTLKSLLLPTGEPSQSVYCMKDEVCLNT
jgi:kynureninase